MQFTVWVTSELLCLFGKLNISRRTRKVNITHGPLQWRHNGRDSVSNHQPHDCFLNCSFRRRSKKTSKLRVTGLCVGNSPGTGEFPAQMASNAENVSIWWRHHAIFRVTSELLCLFGKLNISRRTRKVNITHGPLQWRHNGRDSVSNHQPHDCFLNCSFRRRSKKTSKLRVTGLCVGNSPGTGEFPAQMASNAENVSIWWRHHAIFRAVLFADTD